MKGVHHLITCDDNLSISLGISPFNDTWADEYTGAEYTRTRAALCIDDLQYISLKRTNPRYDNVLYYVRPLECNMRYKNFKHLAGSDNWETFRKNCVDFDRGDEKPQIRVHGNSYFNITNFA